MPSNRESGEARVFLRSLPGKIGWLMVGELVCGPLKRGDYPSPSRRRFLDSAFKRFKCSKHYQVMYGKSTAADSPLNGITPTSTDQPHSTAGDRRIEPIQKNTSAITPDQASTRPTKHEAVVTRHLPALPLVKPSLQG